MEARQLLSFDGLQLHIGSGSVGNARGAFQIAVGEPLRRVDFEDVPEGNPVAIDSRRYASLGILIEGEGGQFVGTDFGYPNEYIPVSGTRMYAPGPVAPGNAGAHDGGHFTTVRFEANGPAGGAVRASVAAFGLTFHDVDYPGIGATTFRIYDEAGGMAEVPVPTTGNGGSVFVGVIVTNASGGLVPAIRRVELVNGSGWPGVYATEGVVMDDFVFTAPSTETPRIVPSLTVRKPNIRLGQAVRFQVDLPDGARNARIEYRRAGRSRWQRLPKTNLKAFVPKTAGVYEIRVAAQVNGATVRSPITIVTVHPRRVKH